SALEFALPAGELAAVPDYPVAILHDHDVTSVVNVLAMIIEGDWTNHRRVILRSAQLSRNLGPIRADLLDDIHQEVGFGITVVAPHVRGLVIFLRRVFLQEQPTLGQLVERLANAATERTFGNRPEVLDKVV